MRLIQEKYIQNRSLFFDLENQDYLNLLNGNPNLFIQYLKSYEGWNENDPLTIFIDEIQYLENPTSFLKYLHD